MTHSPTPGEHVLDGVLVEESAALEEAEYATLGDAASAALEEAEPAIRALRNAAARHL